MQFNKYFYIFLAAVFILTPIFSFADESPKTQQIILFHGEECPHCIEERKFLIELKKERPNLEVIEYEVWHNSKNRDIFLEKANSLGVKNPAVPFTIIGDQYLIGFDKPENSGEKIKKMLDDNIVSNGNGNGSNIISVPILGEINTKETSLPLLSIILGTLDGFNPCSMWALVVLLTLVLATRSRKKVFIVGSVFIITSFISYFLFMTAWFNAFIFIGFAEITRIVIAIIAIIAGGVAIYKFFTAKPGVCEVTDFEQQQKITDRIKNVLEANSFWLLVIGVIGIAFSVNIIEMLCSLGIPVIFTKMLALNNLASWKQYMYIGLYDFFYMIDDIIVLLLAGFSMKFIHLSTKYSHYSRLLIGLAMIILGLIFLISPQILML